MKVFYTDEPDRLKVCPLPDRTTDAWLRKNIHQEETQGGEAAETVWAADEVYINTRMDAAAIDENFDAIFESESADPPAEYTTAERLDAIEAVIIDLLGVIG